MSHTHIEFWFSGGDFEGTRFYWFDDDGLTSVIHPDMAGLNVRERNEKQRPYRDRESLLLRQVREQDKNDGVPMRNVYDMKVYRDGRHEFQFYHDAELAADQLARTEESERKEAELRQKKQAEFDALSEEEKQATAAGKGLHTTEENTPDRYEICLLYTSPSPRDRG